jgi:hypothetical protein
MTDLRSPDATVSAAYQHPASQHGDTECESCHNPVHHHESFDPMMRLGVFALSLIDLQVCQLTATHQAILVNDLDRSIGLPKANGAHDGSQQHERKQNCNKCDQSGLDAEFVHGDLRAEMT